MKQEQNIYDNSEFFEGYKSIRDRGDSHNDLVEQPAMAKHLPDVKGKTVLDLGCGYGQNCIDFIRRGAEFVVGIDLSEKMLEVAVAEASDEKIRYIRMSMTDIATLGMKFDFIYSSLAFHYVEDFDSFAYTLYSCLNDGGQLLFSQEHPLNTAGTGRVSYYNFDDDRNAVAVTVSDYSEQGIRKENWFVDGVIKYHRTFSGIVNPILSAGFKIECIDEPMPSAEAVLKRKSLERYRHKPLFIIIKAIK